MKKYVILCNPGHNWVYYKSSMKLALAELAVVSHKMSTTLHDAVNEEIAGLEYLAFRTRGDLLPSDIEILSGLSFIYALYEIVEAGGVECLKPIQRTNFHYIDEGISSILKYTGKTNELFTRMLINTAYYSLDGESSQNINLLDPVAGKGTTLFEGLIKGFNVYGIEVGDKAVAEAYNFMKKYLESIKYKHTSDIIKLSGPNKTYISKKYAFKIAKTKEEQKEKDTRVFEIIAGNSMYATAFYKKGFFDLVVGDLPYGVQHGNVTNQKQGSLTRNPSELLERCLPVWLDVLKPGGVVALSWNTNVLPRADMERLFTRYRLSVKNDDAFAGFAHRVDQSIMRDIIVAVKTNAKKN